jgi:hypothetical protein
MSDHISKRDAYRVMFTDYPDVVGIKQLCEMLGGISTKTCYKILRSGKSNIRGWWGIRILVKLLRYLKGDTR